MNFFPEIIHSFFLLLIFSQFGISMKSQNKDKKMKQHEKKKDAIGGNSSKIIIMKNSSSNLDSLLKIEKVDVNERQRKQNDAELRKWLKTFFGSNGNGAAPIFESYKQILLAKMPASSSSSGQNEQHQSSHREDDIPLSDPESKSISSSNDKNKKQNSSKKKSIPPTRMIPTEETTNDAKSQAVTVIETPKSRKIELVPRPEPKKKNKYNQLGTDLKQKGSNEAEIAVDDNNNQLESGNHGSVKEEKARIQKEKKEEEELFRPFIKKAEKERTKKMELEKMVKNLISKNKERREEMGVAFYFYQAESFNNKFKKQEKEQSEFNKINNILKNVKNELSEIKKLEKELNKIEDFWLMEKIEHFGKELLNGIQIIDDSDYGIFQNIIMPYLLSFKYSKKFETWNNFNEEQIDKFRQILMNEFTKKYDIDEIEEMKIIKRKMEKPLQNLWNEYEEVLVILNSYWKNPDIRRLFELKRPYHFIRAIYGITIPAVKEREKLNLEFNETMKIALEKMISYRYLYSDIKMKDKGTGRFLGEKMNCFEELSERIHQLNNKLDTAEDYEKLRKYFNKELNQTFRDVFHFVMVGVDELSDVGDQMALEGIGELWEWIPFMEMKSNKIWLQIYNYYTKENDNLKHLVSEEKFDIKAEEIFNLLPEKEFIDERLEEQYSETIDLFKNINPKEFSNKVEELPIKTTKKRNNKILKIQKRDEEIQKVEKEIEEEKKFSKEIEEFIPIKAWIKSINMLLKIQKRVEEIQQRDEEIQKETKEIAKMKKGIEEEEKGKEKREKGNKKKKKIQKKKEKINKTNEEIEIIEKSTQQFLKSVYDKYWYMLYKERFNVIYMRILELTYQLSLENNKTNLTEKDEKVEYKMDTLFKLIESLKPGILVKMMEILKAVDKVVEDNEIVKRVEYYEEDKDFIGFFDNKNPNLEEFELRKKMSALYEKMII